MLLKVEEDNKGDDFRKVWLWKKEKEMATAIESPGIQGNVRNIKCMYLQQKKGRDSAEFECCWDKEWINIVSGQIKSTVSSDGKKKNKDEVLGRLILSA